MLPAVGFDYPHQRVANALLVCADCLEWMARAPEGSIHAIITDPPFGLKEFQPDQLEKRAAGAGGIWRIPPSFDGARRNPLPRFTALNQHERKGLSVFFRQWSAAVLRVLLPGAHVFIASNAFLCPLVYASLIAGGLEFRGQLIRTVRTLRGGDRPKNAEEAYPEVCSLPRGEYEPWGIFRKPLPSGMTLGDCLRRYGTGGLRRRGDGSPFADIIASGRTSAAERAIAGHPSVKPQAFLRELTEAVLPLGTGVILDPFMGSGSTLAAAIARGRECIGVERDRGFFAAAGKAIPRLAALRVARDQLALALG